MFKCPKRWHLNIDSKLDPVNSNINYASPTKVQCADENEYRTKG
jgi:hypothetical protein